MPKLLDFSYEGDIALLYKGFMYVGNQPFDPEGKKGAWRAYRSVQYFHDGIISYETGRFSEDINRQIDETDDHGDFTDEQLEELDQAGEVVSRDYKGISMQDILDVPVYEVVEEPGEYPPRKGIIPKLPEEARGDVLFFEFIRDLARYEALSEEDAQRHWEGYKG